MSVSSARPIAFYRSSNVFWRQAEPRTLLPRNREISSLVQNMTATIIELVILIFHLFQKQRKGFFSFILFYFQTYFGADIHFKQHITKPQCGKTTYILKNRQMHIYKQFKVFLYICLFEFRFTNRCFKLMNHRQQQFSKLPFWYLSSLNYPEKIWRIKFSPFSLLPSNIIVITSPSERYFLGFSERRAGT